MGKKSRPSVGGRDTRKTKAKRDAELDRGLELTFKGETYTLRIGDVTPAYARELRQRTGYGFLELFSLLAQSPDVDIVSAWIWLARRVDGEDVDLAEVDEEVTYEALTAGDLEVGTAAEGPGDSGPEA